MPPHFPLTPHLIPLTLSLPHSRPSGQVRDTSPLPFCKKTPLFHLNSNPFTKSQSYIYLSLCKLLLFFLISTQELSSLQIPLLPPPNPNPKNSPKLFHLHLKTSRIHQGLHHRTPPSTTTSRSTSSTSSFNNTWWIEAIIFSTWSSFQLDPSKWVPYSPRPRYLLIYLWWKSLQAYFIKIPFLGHQELDPTFPCKFSTPQD